MAYEYISTKVSYEREDGRYVFDIESFDAFCSEVKKITGVHFIGANVSNGYDILQAAGTRAIVETLEGFDITETMAAVIQVEQRHPDGDHGMVTEDDGFLLEYADQCGAQTLGSDAVVYAFHSKDLIAFYDEPGRLAAVVRGLPEVDPEATLVQAAVDMFLKNFERHGVIVPAGYPRDLVSMRALQKRFEHAYRQHPFDLKKFNAELASECDEPSFLDLARAT